MVLRGQKPGAGEVERVNPRGKLTAATCRRCSLLLAVTGLFWLLIGQEEEGQAQGQSSRNYGEDRQISPQGAAAVTTA